MHTVRKQSGFTIIEVVLVLAIAGLIFLMVFIALPALQRSQADTQRRSDAGRFLSQISNYQTNNRGNVPADSGTGLSTFISQYMNANGDSFNDPTGDPYNVKASAPTALGDLQYETGATCDSTGAVTGGQAARKVAVAIKLTSGIYCTNN